MRALAGLISEQNNLGRPELPAWRHVYGRGTAGRRNSAATEIGDTLEVFVYMMHGKDVHRLSVHGNKISGAKFL